MTTFSSGFGLWGWVLLLVAPMIGSFVAVIADRLPEGRPIAWSRSYCETCGTPLGARDLVPLLSWLALRGRCRHCGHSVGWSAPAVELAALLLAIAALCVDDPARALLDCILGWWLLALAVIDLRRWLLPDL